MSIIGRFIRDKDGNWIGTIRTLTINAKLRLVPTENRDNDNVPAFRAFVGRSRVGDAWPARSTGENPRDYLRLRLDDPTLPERSARPCSNPRTARKHIWSGAGEPISSDSAGGKQWRYSSSINRR
jgi:uncharacterized protein (DUF736 family)